jgi:hypothetical protein
LYTSAVADSGVGITPGIIDVEDVLKPGGRYTLPTIGVINTGDSPQRYAIAFSHEREFRALPEAWVNIQPKEFDLKAGESQAVALTITIPGSAEPGDYSAYVEARMIGDGDQALQGGVATTLEVSVSESGWLETFRRQLTNMLEDSAPWSYVLGAAGVLAFVYVKLRHRVRFKSPIEFR